MLTPASKVSIWAADDGIVLQAKTRQNQPAPERVKISYKSHAVVRDDQSQSSSTAPDKTLDVHGIVGLLRVSSAAYLLVVTQRERVAEINAKAIYVVKDVSVIPLASRRDADEAINKAAETQKKGVKPDLEVDDSQEEDSLDDGGTSSNDEGLDDTVVTGPALQDENSGSLGDAAPVHKRRTSVAEDVIGKKGRYGRFVDRWFSKKGWSVGGRRMQGMSVEERSDDDSILDVGKPEAVTMPQAEEDGKRTVPEEILKQSSISPDLLTKFVRTIRVLFSSNSYFFAYDHDITRRIGSAQPDEGRPLHEIVDPLYFWNRHLLIPFTSGKHHAFALPLMQGFVGQRSFTLCTSSEAATGVSAQLPSAQVDGTSQSISQAESSKDSPSDEASREQEWVITLISRRSVKRSGLRYLRRGVDREGHAANSVETEQILSRASGDASGKVYSFILLRGSIPLLFSQSPYLVKPHPILNSSEGLNRDAMKKHFDDLASRYGGDIEVVSLVDKQGSEVEIGRAYEEYVSRLQARNDGPGKYKVDFHWFDFHHVCRGMKFENVRQLVDLLEEKLNEFGFTVIDSSEGGRVVAKQTGFVRVNCMDCLDRTNVAQSALARAMLERQLQQEGYSIAMLAAGSSSSTGHWFEILWADNGDAISREYSSTAALKGDFTRQGRRGYRGVLNDARLTLLRYYHNMINDHFAQAVIDLLLGNVDESVFEEFEMDFMTRDPMVGMGMLSLLSAGDETGSGIVDTIIKAIVTEPSEKVLRAWTFLCPHDSTSLRSLPMKETICILTTTALYTCPLDDLATSSGTSNPNASVDDPSSSPASPAASVPSVKKISLRSITSLQYGVYIISTFTSSATDEERNVGFVVRCLDEDSSNRTPGLMAFKYLSASSFALSASSASSPQAPATKETAPLHFIESICREIQSAAKSNSTTTENTTSTSLSDDNTSNNMDTTTGPETGTEPAGTENTKHDDPVPDPEESPSKEEIELINKDIISLKEARQGTGLVEWGVYRVKRYIWAS